jgi:hypothetical protein
MKIQRISCKNCRYFEQFELGLCHCSYIGKWVDDDSMCNVHDLKITSKYFIDLVENNKNFEIRKNDRNFKIGDILKLNEINAAGEITGKFIKREVTYILENCELYGLKDGYCIMAVKKVGE